MKKRGEQTNKYELTEAEQKTTAAYKILSAENEGLKKELEDAQNQLKKINKLQIKNEKENTILKYKLNFISLIEFSKFVATAFIGVAGAYLVSGEYKTAMNIGIPAIAVFGIIVVISGKK
jgi:cell shape-determining protein MreC